MLSLSIFSSSQRISVAIYEGTSLKVFAEKKIESNKIKLYGYKAGTWGPQKCNDLFRNENNWRYPCKNLVNDGEICEL